MKKVYNILHPATSECTHVPKLILALFHTKLVHVKEHLAELVFYYVRLVKFKFRYNS